MIVINTKIFNPKPQVILHKTLPLQYFVMSHIYAKIARF